MLELAAVGRPQFRRVTPCAATQALLEFLHNVSSMELHQQIVMCSHAASSELEENARMATARLI